MKTSLLFATALCATATWAADFQLAVPDSGDAPPQGGEAVFDVEATEGLDWDVSQVTDNWLVVQDTAGSGDGRVTYQVEPNPSTAPRSAKIRLSAHLPEPEVDLSRGLIDWNDDSDTIFNGDVILGREWKTDSTETMQFSIVEREGIHHLFDFYNGIASLYVNENDCVVFQDRNGPQVSSYKVEPGIQYKVFLVRDLHNTDIYVGKDKIGPAEKLFRTEILDVTGYGSSSYPEPGNADPDTVPNGTIDYWDRTLSEAEVQTAITSTERPWATKDTTQAPYTDLAEFYSLDSWAHIQIYYDHHLHLAKDRFGWYGGAYEGGVRAWNRDSIKDPYPENRATSATYSFWCRWNSFVPGTVFSYYAYKNDTLEQDPPVTSCVTLDESGHLGLFDTFAEVACELNRWYMVTVAIDGNSYTLYLDGEQILTSTEEAFDTAYPEFWELGGGRTVEYIYDRVVPETYDDLSHFKKALNDEEVKALYEAEKPLEVVYTVNQAPQEYEVSITPNVPVTVPLRSAMRVFTVTIPSHIAWEAVSNADWIKIEAGATGMGNGTVQIITDTVTDAPNGYSRMGTLTIAGQTVYVIQRNFDLSLSPLTATYKSAGGSGEIDVNVADGIPWTIDATADWVKVTSEPGTGHGTVTYTVEPNKTGEARSAFIIVSGSYHTVTQNAESVVAVETVGEGSVSGGGTVPDDTEVTLTATPAEGYVFSHWTGDATGTANPLTFTAEGAMSVVAHFVPQAAVDAQVEAAIEAGGYVTKEQVKDLSFGAPIIDVEGDSVKVGIRLQSANSLSGNPTWETVKPDAAEADAEGVISVTLPREGNAAFYRFLSPEAEAETPTDPEP